MSIYALLLYTGVGFCYFGLMFRPLEMTFPAKPGQRFFRPGWFTDFCFFLGQNLIWTDLVFWGLSYFSGWINSIVSPSFRQTIASQALWLQALEVVVLSDLCIYWGHRLQHSVGFL